MEIIEVLQGGRGASLELSDFCGNLGECRDLGLDTSLLPYGNQYHLLVEILEGILSKRMQ